MSNSYSFTVTVSENEMGAAINVSGIQPWDGGGSKGAEIIAALRVAMLHETNRLAECIEQAATSMGLPSSSTLH
ncbi:hypothetical protein [Stutzerimonas kirkiae]|uniref:hypothetical protein n=1 Tax=Stutzerimonas kirkiae TaxID=2211392 RepID=UPI00103836DB|nr:hypothetical protein [Stutzerimonas kirkiae]